MSLDCPLPHSHPVPVFFFNDTAAPETYTLSLHDALPICLEGFRVVPMLDAAPQADLIVTTTGNRDIVREEHFRVLKDGCLDRKSTRLNSSHVEISYAVFCLKKKNKTRKYQPTVALPPRIP